MSEPEVGVPPEGAHHYEDISEVPEEIQKYWYQRKDIFSRYDEGIWMTDTAWFGVTAEPIANSIATHIASAVPDSKRILIDAFAGAGGNSIAFALSGRWSRIFAIEKDPLVLACAKHNAAVYGVEKKIWWIEDDCFEVLKKRLKSVAKEAVVFASPPWGGPGYVDAEIFNLQTMQPYNLDHLYTSFTAFASHVVLFLPRNSDLNQLAMYAKDEEEKLEVTHYCMRGSSKAICVFFGGYNWE